MPLDISNKIEVMSKGEMVGKSKSFKKLGQMRQKLGVEALKQRMASGQEALLERNKAKDAEERVREREDIDLSLGAEDGRARTRN